MHTVERVECWHGEIALLDLYVMAKKIKLNNGTLIIFHLAKDKQFSYHLGYAITYLFKIYEFLHRKVSIILCLEIQYELYM